LDIIKCTKLNEDGFGLTLFLNTPQKTGELSKKLSWLKEHTGGRKVNVILFCGEPMVPEFGSHVLPDNLGKLFLSLNSIFKDKLNIEIYSDLLVPHDSFKDIVYSLIPFKTKFSWKFTPEFYSETSMKDLVLFMRNFEFIQKSDCLGITSFIISEANKSLDKHIYETLIKKFPKASIYPTPKQGEEYFFYTSRIGSLENTTPSHQIIEDLDVVQKVSYQEIIVRGYNNFKNFYCDTKNHAVMDLSGNLYACMSAYAHKDILFSKGTKKNFLYKLGYTRCTYASCDYDDNMSVVR